MNTDLELVIDYSRSMGPFVSTSNSCLLADGSTRMTLAKKVLINDIIPTLDYVSYIRIKSFFSNDQSKQPVIQTVYQGQFNRAAVISAVQALRDPVNTGGSPIGAALQASIDALKKSEAIDKKIILVTDGEETDGGDFMVTAEKGLKNHHIDCNIFIIGIGQNGVTAAKCEQVSISTNGGYVNLATVNYDREQLSNILRQLTFKVISSSISNVQDNTQKVISEISKTIEGVPKESSKAKELNVEVINILAGHARSIELINKQVSKVDDSINRLDTSLNDINDGVAKISSDAQRRIELFEENSKRYAFKLYSKVDQIGADVVYCRELSAIDLKGIADSLEKQVMLLKGDIADIKNNIESNTSKISATQSHQRWLLQALIILSLFIIFVLAFLVLSAYR